MEETLTRVSQPINSTVIHEWVQGLDLFSYIALLIVFTVFITLTILEFKSGRASSISLSHRDSQVE
jgi:hypothetical protein